MRPANLVLAAPLLLLSWAPAQDSALDFKLRPELRVALARAAPTDRLPVYIVMRDRLGYHDWYPRVATLDVEARRALVIRELQQHARRTQTGVLADLRAAHDRGRAGGITANWLGNFVQLRGTPDVIRAAAARADVWEIWHDVAPPPGAVEDGAQLARSAAEVPGTGPAAVGAQRVWALGFRGAGIVVMNADSGINVLHFGLSSNLWQNPGEIANGIDDDGNGFIDDINGWNFQNNNNYLDDNGGHGTSTAGVLVADSTCTGATIGIAPAGKVMTGLIATEADQWNAIQYALMMGAHTQTSSHSYKNNFTPPPNYMMHRDVGEATLAAGLIRTNSTSNNGGVCQGAFPEIRQPFNVALPGSLPPPYLDPNQTLVGRKGGVIGVGAYNLTGALYSQSPCGPSAWSLSDLLVALPAYPIANWRPGLHDDYPWSGGAQLGLLKPDIVAPTGTQTTVSGGPTCNIGNFGGTSNSTPIVGGCLMLWKGANPSLGPEDLAMVLHQSAQDAGVLPGKENTWGAGRVDAFAGLQLALAVHRVNGEPAWDVMHRSGSTVTLELDSDGPKPVLIAVGLVRQEVGFGILTSGIGSTLFAAYSGYTGPTGAARIRIPVAPTSTPYTVFTQAFVDDRAGATGGFLASNVIEIRVVP